MAKSMKEFNRQIEQSSKRAADKAFWGNYQSQRKEETANDSPTSPEAEKPEIDGKFFLKVCGALKQDASCPNIFTIEGDDGKGWKFDNSDPKNPAISKFSTAPGVAMPPRAEESKICSLDFDPEAFDVTYKSSCTSCTGESSCGFFVFTPKDDFEGTCANIGSWKIDDIKKQGGHHYLKPVDPELHSDCMSCYTKYGDEGLDEPCNEDATGECDVILYNVIINGCC